MWQYQAVKELFQEILWARGREPWRGEKGESIFGFPEMELIYINYKFRFLNAVYTDC